MYLVFPSHFTVGKRQNMCMRTRSVAAAAALILGLAGTPAIAAEKPKPKPTSIAPGSMTSAVRTLPEPFKTAVRSFLLGKIAREEAIDAINRAFATAIKVAQRDHKSARTAAKDAESKMSAEATRKAAIAAATTARQDAIDALGPATN